MAKKAKKRARHGWDASIGLVLRGARNEIPDLTQRQVSEMLGLTESAWNLIEKGNRHITVAELLDAAEILRRDPADLITAIKRHRERMDR